MQVNKELLRGLGVTRARADKHYAELKAALAEYHVDTPLRVAHFLAQVLHESGKMRFVVENLNYSADALRRVFGRYFTGDQADAYARQPAKIGARVYGGRMGNGPEASGDGFRYRGRGLIQLTGKTNYVKFRDWLGGADDVVAEPDLVATRYPVRSAVYYWDANELNALADADDAQAVTRRINGGLNGLDDRVALLHRAKQLLDAEFAAPDSRAATHTVTASMLNIRSRPVVSNATRIGALPEGTAVTWVADADRAGWARVRAVVSGQVLEGYVSAAHLARVANASRGASGGGISGRRATRAVPASHLAENRRDISRARDGGRAYPLGERGRARRGGASPAAKARGLLEIVRYLDSENPTHLRYQPKSGTTYCNIYAHDYCYLAGVFLPRVWWMDRALQRIQSGETVAPRYADTVRELTANMLHDWLGDQGADFGWVRVFDSGVLQASANAGEVALVVAQRRDLNRSGHVVAVAPEHDEWRAARGPDGTVRRALESQAGTTNHRFVVKRGAWWSGEKFRAFSFWRHP